MDTSPQKRITFMYFWLNYVAKGNVERIPIVVKNIGHLFYMASEVRLTHYICFCFLTVLEDSTELTVCMKEQIQ